MFKFSVLILILFSLAPSVIARDGDLDTTYGNDGDVSTNPKGFGGRAQAIAIQADRKLLVGGIAYAGTFATQSDFGVIRYNLDGTLDSSFGSGGKVFTDFFNFQDEVRDLAIQPDGKIVAVGMARTLDGALLIGLARYNANGTLDTTFGAGGKVTTAVDGFACAVIIQPDRKIVVAGRGALSGSNVVFALARYLANGTLDNSFGSGGTVLTDFGGFDVANDLIVQPDGKLVAVGVKNGTSSQNNYALARYNPDGSLDSNFGAGGKVETDFFNADDRAQSVALQSDGKIVVAGGISISPSANPIFGLARYNADGSPDNDFGSSGKVVTNFGGFTLTFVENYTVDLQPDGKIISTGWCNQGFALTRYLPNGALDPSFGPAGSVVTPGDAPLFGAKLQPDGKLLVAGGGGAQGLTSARYLTAPQDVPILQTDGTNGQAVAVDSVLLTRSPFSVTNNLNFSSDQRTRITLFAANLNLAQGEDASSITVAAHTSGGPSVVLPVEHFGETPGCPWFKQIIVKLPDQLAGAGTVFLSITHGATSNEGSIFMN